MATKKTDDAFDFSSGDYVKQYEEKAKKFAQDAQTEASYTIDEAKETVNKMKEARNDSMKLEVDFDKYIEFVDGMTSSATKDVDAWVERIRELQGEGVQISRLTTAAVGMSAEAGEFMEIVKKINFQGKPFNEDNRDHLIIELGDIMWYVAQACMALGVGIDDVIWKNTMKLAKRYPSGGFDIGKSENRQAGDR
jgi:NTP pyrophosphatase (non-canonical NTP hydrolase)